MVFFSCLVAASVHRSSATSRKFTSSRNNTDCSRLRHVVDAPLLSSFSSARASCTFGASEMSVETSYRLFFLQLIYIADVLDDIFSLSNFRPSPWQLSPAAFYGARGTGHNVFVGRTLPCVFSHEHIT